MKNVTKDYVIANKILSLTKELESRTKKFEIRFRASNVQALEQVGDKKLKGKGGFIKSLKSMRAIIDKMIKELEE